MTPQTLGLLVGGLLPALFFGYSNVAVKLATNAGMSVAYVLIFAGLGNLLIGGVLLFLMSDHTVSLRSGFWMFTGGTVWSLGMMCVTFGIVKYEMPVSQLAPLYNMNTLVAVVLALWIFAEWQSLRVPQLVIGSIFIVLGGTLVARA